MWNSPKLGNILGFQEGVRVIASWDSPGPCWITVNPGIRPQGAYLQKRIFKWSLFEGSLILGFALSSKVSLKDDIIFSIS